MSKTTITLTQGNETRTHNLDFTGLSGAILWTLLGCVYLFLFAFSTTYWQMNSNTASGLWTAWTLGGNISDPPAWLSATQAMACLALICLLAALVLAFIYMMFHQVNKNFVLYGLAGASFSAGLFLFLTIVIYGAEAGSNLHISYAFAVISTILALLSGGLAIWQIHKTQTAIPPAQQR